MWERHWQRKGERGHNTWKWFNAVGVGSVSQTDIVWCVVYNVQYAKCTCGVFNTLVKRLVKFAVNTNDIVYKVVIYENIQKYLLHKFC